MILALSLVGIMVAVFGTLLIAMSRPSPAEVAARKRQRANQKAADRRFFEREVYPPLLILAWWVIFFVLFGGLKLIFPPHN